jgi:aspartyl-tRNA(Asn)/glutamyl-tRNA(Gln) amidotransferase subunit A
MDLTLARYLQGVQEGKFTPQEVVASYLDKAQKLNNQYFSYVRLHPEYIQKHVDAFASRPLKAAPLAIKDIILTEGYITSCGSKILENYVSPYSASCFTRLEEAGGLMLGKSNMDEFAMGSSTETSYFGKTTNPYGKDRVPG